MDIIDKVLAHINTAPEENQAPEGICPLCWGTQEYDGKIRVMIKDSQVDIINHQKKDMILKEFVRQHINGITLDQGEIHSCPTCGEEHEARSED